MQGGGELKRKKRKHFFLITIVIVILFIVAIECFKSRFSLTCTYYDLSSKKITEDVRIVQITDLHDSVFGNDNFNLIQLVQEQSPDLILITGDLVDSGEERTDIATNLITQLCDICPVYISYGNHEYEYEDTYGIKLTTLYENAGATVLEKGYIDITVNGQMIRLGGVYGYCLPESYSDAKSADPEERAFLTEFQNTDFYTVLMCHMPVCWLLNDGLDEWSIDCVFSGHVHGGQVIIPFIGGLYAPDFGWFPDKLEGLYYSSDESKVMALSRGLGSTEVIPRFNNIPEVVVVDLLPQ